MIGILQILASSIPTLLVFIVAIIICLSKPQEITPHLKLTLFTFSGLLLSGIVHPLLQYHFQMNYSPQEDQSVLLERLMRLGYFFIIFNTLLWISVLFCVFGWRKTRQQRTPQAFP